MSYESRGGSQTDDDVAIPLLVEGTCRESVIMVLVRSVAPASAGEFGKPSGDQDVNAPPPDRSRERLGKAQLRGANSTRDTMKARAKTMPSKRAKVVRIPSVTPPKLVKPALLPKHEGREQLRRKYARLSHKHISAVQKLASLSSRRVVAFELGWWALKSTQSALALVRGGKIAICNSRFHDLNRKGGSLRRIDAASSEKALPFLKSACARGA